jgi:hypothetical protein
MDVKSYYRKIHELATELGDGDVVVYSMKTEDGGREGVLTEVSPRVAGKLITENRARVATAEESAKFREMQQEALTRWEEERAAQRIQVQLLTSKPQVSK